MKISPDGIALIKREEGERLKAYPDTKGILTIGVGHTGPVDGRAITPTLTISKEKSSALLVTDITWVEKAINSKVKVPLTQKQYDALCCLVFNIGEPNFAESTVLKRLNNHEYHGAADAFLMWKRSGNDPDILLPRRQREREVFLT